MSIAIFIIAMIISTAITAVCVGLACTSDVHADTPTRNPFWALVMERCDYSAPTLSSLFGTPTRTQMALARLGRFINTSNAVDNAADKAIVRTWEDVVDARIEALTLKAYAANTDVLVHVPSAMDQVVSRQNKAIVRKNALQLVLGENMGRKVSAAIAAFASA
tara:strand:- start:212 stop:700 length:489 start_codon:yes stop_codon:yes gene_type:complete